MSRLPFAQTLALWSLLVGCSAEEDRPPAVSGTYGGTAPTVTPSCEPESEEVDATRACGKATVKLFQRTPTIYFVLDVSGSMSDLLETGGDTKLDGAKKALTAVVGEIGHRVQYGLAAFPAEPDPTNPSAADSAGCTPGEEVFEVREGDPKTCEGKVASGPVISDFRTALSRLTPQGGTPLSPTLKALAPDLFGREEATAVVLITDGSPNCNLDAECEAEDCSLNQWGITLVDDNFNEYLCDASLNCCDPAQVAGISADKYPVARCVDGDASVKEIEALRKGGIVTYVVGMLGGEEIDDIMTRLAVAGGRPRAGPTNYYDVKSLDDLTLAVRTIGQNLSQTCEIELVDRPPLANELNVYFDGELVPSDEVNGWTISENTVTLHGNACDLILSGDIDQIELLSGCETIVE